MPISLEPVLNFPLPLHNSMWFEGLGTQHRCLWLIIPVSLSVQSRFFFPIFVFSGYKSPVFALFTFTSFHLSFSLISFWRRQMDQRAELRSPTEFSPFVVINCKNKKNLIWWKTLEYLVLEGFQPAVAGCTFLVSLGRWLLMGFSWESNESEWELFFWNRPIYS